MKAGRVKSNAEIDFERLVEALLRYSPAAVAFSGGVDSSLLAVAAYRASPSSIAVTINDASVSKADLEDAKKIAKQFGLKHFIVEARARPEEYYENSELRCYYCKKQNLEQAREEAEKHGIRSVLEGTNLDDAKEYRPGIKAVRDQKCRSPLMELGFGKERVREMARMLGLHVWDKPSSPCLASRIAHGVRITVQQLHRIEAAEEFIKKEYGVRILRVRDDGEDANIQVELDELAKISGEKFMAIDKKLKELGYKNVTVDEGGYKSGG